MESLDRRAGAEGFGSFKLQEAFDGFSQQKALRSLGHKIFLREGTTLNQRPSGKQKHRSLTKWVYGVLEVAGVGFEPTTSGL